jgi:phosphatidate cytidylyltransferase
MHLKRWITGLVALPVLVYFLLLGIRWPFYVMVYLASLIGLREFYEISGAHLPRSVRWSSQLSVLLLFGAVYMRHVLLTPVLVWLWVLCPLMISMFTYSSSEGKRATSEMAKAAMGPVYVALPLAMMIRIDQYPMAKGNLWVFFLLLVVFAGDTGAFYCGKLFGKHKLHESVSPGKTWEGSVGGFLSSLLTAIFFLRFVRIHPLNAEIVMMVFFLSVFGQIGDLAESMLKRNHGMKDSGHILPGHGGLLDRIDALLFASPILYTYLYAWKL